MSWADLVKISAGGKTILELSNNKVSNFLRELRAMRRFLNLLPTIFKTFNFFNFLILARTSSAQVSQ